MVSIGQKLGECVVSNEWEGGSGEQDNIVGSDDVE